MNTRSAPHKMLGQSRWDASLILLSRLTFLLSSLVLIGSLGLYVVLTNDDLVEVDISIGLMIALAASANGVVGLLILTRYPRHGVGWLLILLGLTTTFVAVSNLSIGLLENRLVDPITPLLNLFFWIGDWVWFVWVVLLLIFIPLYFPDGRLLSRRWRIVALAGGVSLLAMIVALTIAPDIQDISSAPVDAGGPLVPFAALLNNYIVTPLSTFGILGALLSVILRYRRSGRLQRAQIKWVIFTLLVGIGVGSQMETLARLLPATDPFIEQYDFHIFLLFPIALPVVIGIAILQYRLYDIDLIIRKTLMYALLSGLLGLVYFVTVVLLQTLFDSMSGEQSPLIIVVSTLLIAALFAPLRQRVQAFIDRRFYRQKYDAQQILARFAQTARDEVEMDVLQAELLRVVDETLQPETAVLWFRQGGFE